MFASKFKIKNTYVSCYANNLQKYPMSGARPTFGKVLIINEVDSPKEKNCISLFQLSEFLRRSLMIFIIKGFRTVVFIVISTTFWPICPLTFFSCLSNSGTFMELWTTPFIESMGVACSDSVSHNRVQVLNIPAVRIESKLLRRQSSRGCRFNTDFRQVKI